MKKKTLSITLALIMLFSVVFSVHAGAVNNNVYNNFTYAYLDNKTIEITGYLGKEENPQVPSQINSIKVTGIGDKAFQGCTSINSLVLPNGIEYIGNYAFDCATNLLSVQLPNTLLKIENSAFFSCTRLKSIDLPESLKSIGSGAFYDCTSLLSVDIPNNVDFVGDFAFGNCSNLKKVSTGNGLSQLSNQMFIYCKALEDVELSDNVKIIGRKSFSDCSNLEQIQLPKNLEKIQDSAFINCVNLKELHISCQSIENNAFENCTALENIQLSDGIKSIGEFVFNGTIVKNIMIPKSVTNIAYGAFAMSNVININVDQDNNNYCSVEGVLFNRNMTELIAYPSINDAISVYEIPSTVTSIAPYGFYNCYALNEIKMSDNVETIGDFAFAYATNLSKIVISQSVTSLGKEAFSNCYALTQITIPSLISELKDKTFASCSTLNEVSFDNGIKRIGEYAFSNCIELNSINIPNSLTAISPSAFYLCESLTDFNIDSIDGNFKSIDGVLFSSDGTELVFYPFTKEQTAYIIPDGTQKIADNAFIANSNIKSVVVPDSVSDFGKSSIGYYINFTNDIDRVDNFAIYGSNNLSAQKYADEYNLAYFTGAPVQNKKSISLKAGQKDVFEITNVNKSKLVFSTSDENIAKIDQNGTITAVAKGTTNIIASTGTINFICEVNVTSGSNNNTSELSKYKVITSTTYEQWENDYYEFNKNVSSDYLDNSNIKCYSSNQYIPIMGVQKGGKYLEKTKKIYGEDYGQYNTISDNLSLELGRYKMTDNMVLYSGTNDVSTYTGKSSSLADMKAAIGRQCVDNGVISTSIDHDVATGFGSGSFHTVLEIYAPKSATKGAYIKNMSEYPMEYELLLDKNMKYEVIDAGVRNVLVTDFSGSETTVTERYMKLKIVDSEDEPQTIPTTQVETTVTESTQPSTQAVEHTTAASTATQNPAKPSENPIATGNANVALLFVMIIISLSAIICVYSIKKTQ